MRESDVYNALIDIASNIARRREGALFILSPHAMKSAYDNMFPQAFGKLNLRDKSTCKLIEKLATLDGAVIIAKNGQLEAFGARLKHSMRLPEPGTRHAAAAGTTAKLPGTTAFLVSEGSGWIKILQGGRVIVELDAEKKQRKLQDQVINFLTDRDTALLTAAGASAAVLGLAPVLIIGGSYVIIKTAAGMIKKRL